ncbi:MAG: hypothetical protein JXP34_22470, partial [Planctomycetes bacterium]|nr:hypothetical protein [Planctomycetota bacterium]
MASPESMALVVRAKSGDREAWSALCERYYPRWVRAVHGRMGREVRRLYDTPDIVQSAIAEALRDIGNLRSEGSFFSWVSAIIRRKIADKCRSLVPTPFLPTASKLGWIGSSGCYLQARSSALRSALDA